MAIPPPSSLPITKSILGGKPARVRTIGGHSSLADLYHGMLRAKWRTLFALFVASFIGFNLVFATLYSLDTAGIDWGRRQIDGGPFWRAFVFSVDTMTTVGYGNMAPISPYANIVSIIELALAILFVALVTGMAFARFSRPTARMLFSKVAVISPFEGVPTLMLRCANERHNLIFEANAMMSLLFDEETEGGTMRLFHDMKLVRAKNPVFALTWTIMHPIDDDSPLKPWLDQQSAPPASDIVVVVSGTDDRTGHTMYGRCIYGSDDLRWNARFVDVLCRDGDGKRAIDYRRFNDVAPMEAAEG